MSLEVTSLQRFLPRVPSSGAGGAGARLQHAFWCESKHENYFAIAETLLVKIVL